MIRSTSFSGRLSALASASAYLDTDDSSFDPETGELMLGNIVISKERAKEQAEESAIALLKRVGLEEKAKAYPEILHMIRVEEEV